MTLWSRIFRKLSKLSLLLLVLGLAACGGTRSNGAIENEEFVWPLPPEQPRIKFIQSIHSEMDVGRKRSLTRRISEAIFGRAPLRALQKPLAVHVDRSGRVFVVDTGRRKVFIFDFNNKRMDVLGQKGKGRLLSPLGVTTDVDGKIYVADAGGCRVMVYDSTGNFVNAFGGKSTLLRPVGIAVNSALQRIYVVDTWAHQVKVFDSEAGDLLFKIGLNKEMPENEQERIEGALDQTWNRGDGHGEFRFPTYISIGPDGEIYIVDTLNFRVQVFSPDGEFLRTFGEIGNLPGNFYRPKGIGLDSDGHIYVADASFNNVQIFNQQGQLMLNFGTFGSGLADLRLPAGLYISPQDRVYVVDQFNNRVQVYQYFSDSVKKESKLLTKKERM